MNYLDGYLDTTNALQLNDFVKSEPKVGIGRDNITRTAEDSLLYRVDMNRLEGVELRIIAKSLYQENDIAQSIVHLGGETKLIQLDPIGSNTKLKIDKPNLNKDSFKIYLSTPAFFTKLGWQPDLSRFNINARLVAACVGKPLHIGGYDMLNNRPKPMLKAVPAGSVYYYESDESPEKILSQLHGQSISDFLPEQGYGIAFIGNVKLPKK
ncbi:MAG: type III-B CRISPR module-associated Cmr3 family protein [Saprospiraceae bacterium]